MFPNPSTSAAYYTKSLSIGYHRNGAPADAEEGDWIPTFSCIEHLEVHIFSPKTPLAPFHGFSPAIKSLHIKIDPTYSTCQIFNLICSFPLLQDLSLKLFSFTYHDDCFDEQSAIIPPSSSPVLTGSLELSVYAKTKLITYLLLSLPSGLHFRELKLILHCKGDGLPTGALVEGCSSTLESLNIGCRVPGMFISHLG